MAVKRVLNIFSFVLPLQKKNTIFWSWISDCDIISQKKIWDWKIIICVLIIIIIIIYYNCHLSLSAPHSLFPIFIKSSPHNLIPSKANYKPLSNIIIIFQIISNGSSWHKWVLCSYLCSALRTWTSMMKTWKVTSMVHELQRIKKKSSN